MPPPQRPKLPKTGPWRPRSGLGNTAPSRPGISGHAIHTIQKRTALQLAKRITLIILVLGVGAIIAIGSWFSYSITRPVGEGETKLVTIPPQTSLSGIAKILADEGLIRDRVAFELYARIGPARGQLKPGPYQLKASMSTVQILDYLAAGKIAVRTFVAREGQTLAQLATSYEQQGFGTASEFTAAVGTAKLSASAQAVFGQPTSLEGLLPADSYQLVINDTASTLVALMLANLDAKIVPLFQGQSSFHGGLTAYQVMTLASLVEKEASRPADRAGVAGVFYNRLARGTRLESDVTVIYLTGRAEPTAADLALNSPYNTRRFAGLPPTPIADPSLAAIQATLAPTSSDYLFFIGGTDGNVYYARTYAEHQANIARYLN